MGIYNKNGLKMGRKKFNKISCMKTTIALDVPVKHGLHMMVNMEPDRAKYDDMILGGELIKTFDSAPNVKDQALTMKMKIPMIGKKDMDVRVVLVTDFPTVGQSAYVYVPWDKKNDCVSKKKAEGLGNGIISPDPSDPNKCVAVMIEELPSSWMPNFLMNWAVTSVTPRYMHKLQQNYAKYVAAGNGPK